MSIIQLEFLGVNYTSSAVQQPEGKDMFKKLKVPGDTSLSTKARLSALALGGTVGILAAKIYFN